MQSTVELAQSPLASLHRAQGAKMVPFAGYEMPVQYPMGILQEHLHTRRAAGLFDVSHMGQLRLTGADVAAALERLCPADLRELKPGKQKYSFFTDDKGGILDDLMITRGADHFFLVVNAANKAADLAHLHAHLDGDCRIDYLEDCALLALQGPLAARVLARLQPSVADLRFMTGAAFVIGGVAAFVTRSGYTGEDGFEISVPAASAIAFAERLLAEPEVKPIGLGARDSLRLEAGLCLHGNDISPSTNPIEADLLWAIGKRRRVEGGYPGAAILAEEIRRGPRRRRIGIKPEGRAPARAHSEIVDPQSGRVLGEVTSGGFGPSVDGPIAMGYVAAESAAPGTEIALMVRGKPLPARIVDLPFQPHRYFRG